MPSIARRWPTMSSAVKDYRCEALAPGGTARLGAEATARVLESVLLPPRFFVGDPVELRLRVAVPAGVTVAAPRNNFV